LFTDIRILFPNLIICDINEKKLAQAFNKGISAKQILNYLLKNVHPSVLNRKHKDFVQKSQKEVKREYLMLPENVVQQMMIWWDQNQSKTN